MRTIINTLVHKPRTVFIIDGVGACVTAIMLGIVLPVFNSLIGMALPTLHVLAAIAVCFALYSFACAASSGNNYAKLLPPIIIANTVYCIISLSLVVYHFRALTIVGILYFLGEIAIIMAMVYIEYTTLRRLKTGGTPHLQR